MESKQKIKGFCDNLKGVLFATLALYFDRLEKTPSRLEITAVLAELFEEARLDEIRQIAYLSLGRLGPLYETVEFQLAEKLMIRILSRSFSVAEEDVRKLYGQIGDLGEVAEKLAAQKGGSLLVNDIFDRLYEVARAGGEGSVEQKIVWMSEILRQLEPLSAKYFVRVPLGRMRLGFSEKTILDALSFLGHGDKSLKKELEKAFNVYPDIGEIVHRFKEKGIDGVRGIKMKIGAPVLPQLAQRLPTPEEMLRKLGGKVAAEPKFDGERLQLHFDRDREDLKGEALELELEGSVSPKYFVRMFTRNLEEVSKMFPEIALAAIKQLKGQKVVLDGEAVGIDPKSGGFVPFQITIQRKRKHGVKEKALKIPVKYFAFDVLHRDGQDLLTLPFFERRKILEELIEPDGLILPASQRIIDRAEDLKKFLDEETRRGLEGLVVKSPSSPYEAGARGFAWVKYKPTKDTIDAVVLGCYFGRGKRALFGTGSFLVGVYDGENDRFLSLTKVGTGATDEEWQEIAKRCDAIKTESSPPNVDVPKELAPSVWVRPSLVVEIQYDEITRSPLHTSGFALRFPRLVSFRDTKLPEQATSVKEIEEMFSVKLNQRG